VALGTVCDVVALTGLNRAMVAQGLKVMAARGNAGMAALADVARVTTPPGAYHAGFVLGPRVNAGGRVGRAGLGARLLATDDAAEANVLALELDGYNTERREIEARVLEAAREQVEAAGDPGPLVFAAGEGWHPGVIGIVASRLTGAWRRPSAVVAIDGDLAKGSGRSVPGIDLGAAILAARQAGLLVDGGGHLMAAGFTAETARLDELAEYLRRRIGPEGARAPGAHDLLLDGVVSAAAADAPLVALMERAGPYGAGNPEPRLAVPSARVVKADIVGSGHVRAILGGGEGGGRLKAIAFRSAAGPVGGALLAARSALLHVAGHLRADAWQGEVRAQLVIDDVAPAAGPSRR
jgi:single-stranded-DNA-specific exonuclease